MAEVLGVLCQTYSDLVSATMTIPLIAYNDDMRQRLWDVHSDNPKRTLLDPDRLRSMDAVLLPCHDTPIRQRQAFCEPHLRARAASDRSL